MLNAPTTMNEGMGPIACTIMFPTGAVHSGHRAIVASEIPLTRPFLSGNQRVVKASDVL